MFPDVVKITTEKNSDLYIPDMETLKIRWSFTGATAGKKCPLSLSANNYIGADIVSQISFASLIQFDGAISVTYPLARSLCSLTGFLPVSLSLILLLDYASIV